MPGISRNETRSGDYQIIAVRTEEEGILTEEDFNTLDRAWKSHKRKERLDAYGQPESESSGKVSADSQNSASHGRI